MKSTREFIKDYIYSSTLNQKEIAEKEARPIIAERCALAHRKKITIVIQYDDANAYFLVIDRNSGAELERSEYWMYSGTFDEHEIIKDIIAGHSCDDCTVIHW